MKALFKVVGKEEQVDDMLGIMYRIVLKPLPDDPPSIPNPIFGETPKGMIDIQIFNKTMADSLAIQDICEIQITKI